MAIAVIALIAVMTVPGRRMDHQGAKAEAAARELASALRRTRLAAIRTGAPADLQLALSPNRFRAGGEPWRDLPPQLAVRFEGAAELLAGADQGAIRFFPDGSASGGAITLGAGDSAIRVTTRWLLGATRLEREGRIEKRGRLRAAGAAGRDRDPRGRARGAELRKRACAPGPGGGGGPDGRGSPGERCAFDHRQNRRARSGRAAGGSRQWLAAAGRHPAACRLAGERGRADALRCPPDHRGRAWSGTGEPRDDQAGAAAPKRNGAAGFALIDILIAVALLGLIATMIGGAVGQAARLGVAGEMRLADQARVDNVRALLHRQIEGALPLPSDVADDQSGVAFVGGSTAFEMAARRPAQLLPGGVRLARFELLPTTKPGAGGALQASWRLIDPARPLGGQDSRIETVQLLDGIGGFRLRYFGRKASGASGWHEDWRGETRLPSLISLDMEPTTTAGWRWPPLVAAPRITTLPTLTAPKNPLAASKGAARE